jgi:hypothetical protein
MQTQLPPDPPELPAGLDPEPRWPAWYALAGFFGAFFVTLVLVGIVAGVTGTGPEDETPTFTIVATLIQSVAFMGTALLLAALTLKPKAWHFGLRPTRFWPAVGWAALGIFTFYVLAAIYAAAVQPDVEQDITEALGADEGTLGLVAAGFMVIAVAPVAEEFFFRGFFYRALRTRFGVLLAATIDGLVFGLVHFEGSDAALLLPPLAALGFIFCLIYEQTGSLYPVIALHAINNSVAFAVQADGEAVSAVLGPLMVAACAIVPALWRTAPRARPALR